MQKKTRNVLILLPFIAFLVYFALDFFNVFGKIGVHISNINIDVFGIAVNALIVITLYIVSFCYIDNKQIEKDNNSRNTANVLLSDTFKYCIKYLELLNNTTIIRTYLIPKINPNQSTIDSPIVNNFKSLPFSSYETIMSLASGGYISKTQLSEYTRIKKDYENMVDMKITFFDIDEYPDNDHKELSDKLKKDYNELLCRLKTQLSNLNNNSKT